MNNSYITIIKEKRTALSRKRIPLNQNGCTANFRIGVPFEQNLHTTDYDFYYGYTDQEMLPLVRGLDASLLSSVVNNGFTGTYIGMYTSSNHQPSTNYADFDWFNYQGE